VCFDVTFDVVLFKPFIGEVLEGTLTSADASGAHVSVGFFSRRLCLAERHAIPE
jgi:DNA-directed RNA polymerase subunit E'/Rpb7